MSDAEYNMLHERIVKEYPNWDYVKRGWSEDPCPVDILRKYGMEQYIKEARFTYKTESIPSIRGMTEFQTIFIGLNKYTRVSYKHDGWNTQVDYYNGALVGSNTRGRGTNAKEIDIIAHLVPNNISIMGHVKVVGELTIPNSKWPYLRDTVGVSDQRAAVSTALSQGLYDCLEFHAFKIIVKDNEDAYPMHEQYNVLRRELFKVPRYLMVDTYDKLLKAIDLLSSTAGSYQSKTDGLVVENDTVQIALRVKYWAEEEIQTYVVGYNEQTTPYARSVVVEVYPVKAGDKTIHELTMGSIERIIRYNLRPGAPVSFVLRSGANPVFSETGTIALQKAYAGDWEAFRSTIV